MQLALWFAPSESISCKAVSFWNNQQYEIIENIFVEAVRDHGNMKGRHQQYAATFTGMVNTYIGLFLNGYVQLNTGVTQQLVHQFMHGILS